jgi:hypothetical protein
MSKAGFRELIRPRSGEAIITVEQRSPHHASQGPVCGASERLARLNASIQPTREIQLHHFEVLL